MFHNYASTRDRELKFCMSKHLEKMCLETKFQPFWLRNDKDIHCPKNDVSVPKQWSWLYFFDRNIFENINKKITCCLLEVEVQSLAAKVDLCIPSGSLNISVISQPKWLKFGLQAHFLKMFGHTKFQLSITCTFRIMKLLVEITKYLH